MSRYVFLDDGRIACVVTRNAVDALHLLDPRSGALEPLDLDWTGYSTNALAAGAGRVVYSAASPVMPPTLVALDVATGREEVLRRSLEVDLERASISVPRAIEFPTGDGVDRPRLLLPAYERRMGGAAGRAAAAPGDLPRRPYRA